jgi:glucokinase
VKRRLDIRRRLRHIPRSMEYWIGIDLGGTNIKAVGVSGEGKTLFQNSRPTRDGVWEGERPAFAVAVRDLIRETEAAHGPASGIGLCAPGLASPDGRMIYFLQRMPGLAGLDWTDFLQRDRQVMVLNDAHAALLGEVWLGAGKGKRDVAMVTLGTGVGGAIMAGGKLLRGHVGRAGHLGFLSVDSRGPKCALNMPAPLENSISEISLKQRGNGQYPSTRDLVQASDAGDAKAKEIWESGVWDLAVSLSATINAVDPELIIVGGGIAKAGASLFGLLERYMDEVEWRPDGYRVTLVPALLDDAAGAYGSAYAAFRGDY